MDGDFQHVHFLTTRTMINELSNMLLLIFPCISQIIQTFKCTFKSKVRFCASCQSLSMERD